MRHGRAARRRRRQGADRGGPQRSPRHARHAGRDGQRDLRRPTPTSTGSRAIVAELDAVEIIVGLPLALSGGTTASTEDARDFADALRWPCAVPVRLVDERLSTVSAQSALRASGRRRRRSVQ